MSDTENPLREVYLEHIKKQKSSGLSIKKYCEAHNLVPSRFSYYCNYKLKTKSSPASTVSSSFIPVQVKSEDKLLKTKPTQPVIDPIWLAKLINELMG